MTVLYLVLPQNQPPARYMICRLIVKQVGKIMGAGGLCTSKKVPYLPPTTTTTTLLHPSSYN